MKATSADRSEELRGRLDTPTTPPISSAATGEAPEAAAQLLAIDRFWRRRSAASAAGSSSAAAGACSGGVSRAGRALRGRAAQGAQLGQLGARERARGPWGGSLAAFRSRSQRSDASAAESYVLYESTCSVCCVWHVTWPMVKPTTAVRRICMDLLTVCFAIVCALRALSPARVENSDL
jgi:hypothetical protein